MCRFLPAPSVRRATFAVFEKLRNLTISIHALREEGDIFASCFSVHCIQFLSTPSARRATRHLEAVKGPVLISIHALREEGDLLALCRGQLFHISIHALREEGDQTSTAATAAVKTFLSTPSARRATGDQRRSCPDQKISIHALREEGDLLQPPIVIPGSRYFYPRPPRGGRR